MVLPMNLRLVYTNVSYGADVQDQRSLHQPPGAYVFSPRHRCKFRTVHTAPRAMAAAVCSVYGGNVLAPVSP